MSEDSLIGENLEVLRSRYAKDDWVLSLEKALKGDKRLSVHWGGLEGSLFSVLGQAVMRVMSGRLHLLVAESVRAAACYARDFELLLGRDGQVERAFGERASVQAAYSAWVQGRGIRLLVSTAKDLGTLVSPPAVVRRLEVGTSCDLSALVGDLRTQGLEEVAQVAHAGSFALRGAVLDYWMPNASQAHRLEVWGDTLERIGVLAVGTQSAPTALQSVQWEAPLSAEKKDAPLYTQLAPTVCLWLAHPQALFAECNAFDTSPYSVVTFGSADGPKAQSRWPKTTWTLKRRCKALAPLTTNPSFSTLQDAHEPTESIFIACRHTESLHRLVDALQAALPEASIYGIADSLSEGFRDQEGSCTLYVADPFSGALAASPPKGARRRPEGAGAKAPKAPKKKVPALEISEALRGFQVGDYVVHTDHGIGRFAGLMQNTKGGTERIQLVFRDNDLLSISIHALYKLSRYSSGELAPPRLAKLGGTEWQLRKQKIKRRLSELTQELKVLYARRRRAVGWACPADDTWQLEMERSFPYQETPDQLTAIRDIKEDMESPHPMDRLLCGDTGFGKTEVAIRAAFKAISHGRQVALLAPTTLLVMQHSAHFQARLRPFGVRTASLHRFVSRQDTRAILADTQSGKVDLLMGTAKLVHQRPQWKALGLLIIDEEQKFGVQMKERLRQAHPSVDTLSLSATPIPRTLSFSLSGLRDISLIRTPPPARQATKTIVCEQAALHVGRMLARERARKGQIFWVVHRIASIAPTAKYLRQQVPDVRMGQAHGQMTGHEIEDTLRAFASQQHELLLSTNIVENGLDFPNAHTMVIQHAEYFGLADLHQLRGRVGRSDKQGYCYLLCPPHEALTEDGQQRLRVLKSFSELGDGFKIALKDLSIRGGGDLLGREQSGFIQDMGFEHYHQLLDEVRTEHMANESPNPAPIAHKQANCSLDTDLNAHIPHTYIPSQNKRLKCYDEMARLRAKDELFSFTERLKKHFGDPPEPTQSLLALCQLRLNAQAIGCVHLTLKRNTLKLFFNPKQPDYFQSDLFAHIIQFVQQNANRCQLANTQRPCLTIHPCHNPNEPLLKDLWQPKS